MLCAWYVANVFFLYLWNACSSAQTVSGANAACGSKTIRGNCRFLNAFIQFGKLPPRRGRSDETKDVVWFVHGRNVAQVPSTVELLPRMGRGIPASPSNLGLQRIYGNCQRRRFLGPRLLLHQKKSSRRTPIAGDGSPKSCWNTN